MGENTDTGASLPPYLRMDVLSGILVTVVAVVVWFGSAPLPVGELRYIGPGLLPKVLAVVLFFCGIALIVAGLVQTAGAERVFIAVRGPLVVGISILFFAVTIRGTTIGPLVIPQLGLLVTRPLTVIIAGMGSAEARVRELIILGIALTAAGVLVFSDILSMSVPVFPGILENGLVVAWGVDWPQRIAVAAYALISVALWQVFKPHLTRRQDKTEEEQA